MKCVTPMFYRYKIGDKKHGKVVPRNEVLDSLCYDPRYIRHMVEEKNKLNSGYHYIQIPCQKCWACQLKYSSEWATRITLEAQKYEHNWFITLTYDDKNAPIAEKSSWIEYKDNPEDPSREKIPTEEVRYNDGTWGYTLNPTDMDTFLNSLRKHFRDKGKKLYGKPHEGIKYFYCGEYGSTTSRPHYHIILLNCPLDPNEFYGPYVDKKNFKAHWKSKELDRLWQKGMIDVAECEWSCVAYVARYCTKKLNPNSDKREYLENGMYPEFVRMSKGIANDYFEEHYKEVYANDELIMKTIKGNVGSIKPPRAFDKKLKEINPELYETVKRSREKAKDRADKLIETLTDATDKMLLEQEARNLQTKMSLLPRQGEW